MTATTSAPGVGKTGRGRRAQPRDKAAGGALTGSGRVAPGAGPVRPRPRSWGLVTLAALLVVGIGLAGALAISQAGQKEAVLAIGAPIAKGQVIAREDLVSVSVAGVANAIPVEQAREVIGQTAAVDLVEGQILSPAMLAAEPVPAAGRATVGLALDPTRIPSAGLNAGDVVNVIAVPGPQGNDEGTEALDTPPVLASNAEVLAVAGDPVAGGGVLITLVVDASEAARIAAYSTQERVAVIQTSHSDGRS